ERATLTARSHAGEAEHADVIELLPGLDRGNVLAVAARIRLLLKDDLAAFTTALGPDAFPATLNRHLLAEPHVDVDRRQGAASDLDLSAEAVRRGRDALDLGIALQRVPLQTVAGVALASQERLPGGVRRFHAGVAAGRGTGHAHAVARPRGDGGRGSGRRARADVDLKRRLRRRNADSGRHELQQAQPERRRAGEDERSLGRRRGDGARCVIDGHGEILSVVVQSIETSSVYVPLPAVRVAVHRIAFVRSGSTWTRTGVGAEPAGFPAPAMYATSPASVIG